MEFRCREVLLVLCLTVVTWIDVKADAPSNVSTSTVSEDKDGYYFDILDRNGDGITDAEDIAIITIILESMPQSQASNLIQRNAVLVKLAKQGFPMMKQTPLGALTPNTRDAFIEYVQYRASTGAIEEDYKTIVGMILGLYTADYKAVTRPNFHQYLIAAGLNGCDEMTAFDAMDTDHSGKLTYDELIVAAKGYFTSNDPENPANWLFCWRQ